MASFDEVIPPGQAGKIKAEVHTANLSGVLGKTVQVTTNDPLQPAFALNIKARIVASVVLLPAPRMFAYGPGANSARPSGKVLVRKDESEAGELKVTDVRASVPWLKPTARKIEKGEGPIPGVPQAQEGDWLLEVKPTPPPGTSNSVQQVTFRTGLSKEPEVTVPVSVVIPQFVTVQPSELVLRAGTTGGASEGTVLAILRQDVDPQTVKVEARPESFHVETAQAGPTSRHLRLTVRWDPAAAGPKTGILTIRDSDETKEIPIRVN